MPGGGNSCQVHALVSSSMARDQPCEWSGRLCLLQYQVKLLQARPVVGGAAAVAPSTEVGTLVSRVMLGLVCNVPPWNVM